MEQFPIDTYQVSVRTWTSDRGGRSRPALLLKGRDGSTGTEVWLYFEQPNQDMTGGSYMGLRFPARGGRQKLSITMPPPSFEPIYDVLRNEKPITFLYDVKDSPNNPRSATKLVTRAQLGTIDEPIGEGPVDESG